MQFGENVLAILVYGSLIFSGLGAVSLLWLLMKDWKQNKLW